MSAPDERLVDRAVGAINGMLSQADTEGWEVKPEHLAAAVLECFDIREEFKGQYRYDLNGDYDETETVETVEDLVRQMEGEHPGAQRQVRHRWVLTSEWELVRAHITWEAT